MLGEAFHRQFKDAYRLKCTDIDVNEKWLSYLDFRKFEAYKKDVEGFRPDYLFHLGAMTDLEYCELHPDETYDTNARAVEHAVRIANELGIPILYISTAGIFDGKKEVYDESDPPNPLGHYARSKYAGEQFVQQEAKKYLICRPGWMMGGGPRKDKKFINKVMKQIKAGAQGLFVVGDKFGTPTYTHDFARTVKLLIEKDIHGLYNLVCEGSTSRIEVARELLRLLKFEKRIAITQVPSDYFKKEYFAARPESECLINKKLNLLGLNIMRDWKAALAEYIQNDYGGYL